MKTTLAGFEAQDDLRHMFGAYLSWVTHKNKDEHGSKILGDETIKNDTLNGGLADDEPTCFM